MLQIKYKVLAHAKDLPRPAYQTKGSSGLDLYAANIDSIEIKSLQRLSISTGIIFSIPKGLEGQIRPRSGLFIKHGLTCILGTIDSDYRGEIKILLVNLSNDSFIIERGMRIAQIVFCNVIKAKLIQTKILDNTIRGDKGFGSTGL